MGDATPVNPLELGIIRVTGSDASEFLRAQLTNDVLRLGPDRHFLAAWCDAKGRAQLVMRVAVDDNAFWLIVPRELIDSAIKRLRMFVLRLDVELADVSDNYRIDGIHDVDTIPDVNRTVEQHGQFWFGLPGSDSHPRRAIVMSPIGQTPPDGSMPTASNTWALSDIDAGLAQITAATQGEFVPQMLNLHWLMAVDFDKGCYPGQEVIARLHYRGRLTRRVFRLSCSNVCPAPGDPVMAADKTVGMVVQGAEAETDTSHLLAVVQVDAAATEALETQQGQTLTVETLPYATPD